MGEFKIRVNDIKQMLASNFLPKLFLVRKSDSPHFRWITDSCGIFTLLPQNKYFFYFNFYVWYLRTYAYKCLRMYSSL